MLQQRGFYTIKLGNGKQIPLRFCTWTFTRFCEINGTKDEDGRMKPMTLFQLQDELTSGMNLPSLNSLLLCAAEYMCIKEKIKFTYTKIEVDDWIDEMGGIAGSDFAEMISVILASFTDNKSNGQEKKIPEKA